MLLEFSVKNFLSFKNKITLSMEKGKGNEIANNYVKLNDLEVLKTCAIYGANASGKTNLIKAFSCAIMMVRNSNVIPVGGKWNFINPFLFDNHSKKEPTEFEFVFVTNKIKYKYTYATTFDKIISESLEAFYSQKPTTIFARKNTNEYKFLLADENNLRSIETKNPDNKLFLATASNWNYDKTKDAYMWFMNAIDTYDSFDSILKEDLVLLSNEDQELKEFTLKLLREADIIINDFKVQYEEKDMDNNMVDMLIPPVMRNNIPKISSIKIETIHEFKDENNKKSNYVLNMDDESSGTKILFSLAPILKRAFEKGKVIVVDELEKSLHPSLVEYLIKIFNNSSLNKANSQLIFTTHAINLLNLNLLRRDQIWFVEKNTNNGVTDFYPLDSFSVRKDENIQKGYINGRYGAIPFINDISLWADDNIE